MRKIFFILITALAVMFISCGDYEPYPAKFRVYYEKGSSKSGSVPVDPNTYSNGEKAIVLGKGTLVNDDYTFLGWMYNSRIYQIGDEITGSSSDIYLVAAWDDVVETSFEYIIENDEAIITKYTGSNNVIIFPLVISDKPVTEIGDNVFRYIHLDSVSLSKNIKRIGHFSFSNCQLNMTTLTIPDSVISIGIGAFQNNSIKNINFGTDLTSISKGAFSGNDLFSVNLPDNIVFIDDGAFYGNKIEQIFIGADVEIGNDTSLGTNGESFNKFYADNGRQAGEYNYTADAWVLMP